MGDIVEEGEPSLSYKPRPLPYIHIMFHENKKLWKYWPFRPIKVITKTHAELRDGKPFLKGVDLVELARHCTRSGMTMHVKATFEHVNSNYERDFEITACFIDKRDALMYRMSLP